MAKKTYTIGEDSRRLLDALDAFQVFNGELLDALVHIYGEDSGHKFYQEHRDDLDKVERIVMEYLRIQFTQEMATGKAEITI